MVNRYFPLRTGCKLRLEELVFDIMWYSQECHGVMHFPLFTDLRWHRFVYFANQELGKQAFPLLDIEFSWDGINPVIEDRDDILCRLDAAFFAATLPVEGQPDRMRMRPDTEHSVRGKCFGEKFNELAEAFYQITQEIEGLAPID